MNIDQHPLELALELLAPVIDATFITRSARDARSDETKYPALDYVIHREQASTFDQAKGVWRVELVVQFDYYAQEPEDVVAVEDELLDSLAVQAMQFGITSRLRALVRLLTDPKSLGKKVQAGDVKYAVNDWKLVRWVESAYFRQKGSDKLTGASALVVLSMLDLDANSCCVFDDPTKVIPLLKVGSPSARLLELELPT